MRNHFLLKGLALVLTMVVLCTALVTGLGILALNETGLYRQSVEEAYLEHVRGHAQSYADNVLRHYLSQELGGASRQMTENYYGSYHYYGVFNWGKVGYTIRSEAGEAISESGLWDGETVKTRFIFPAAGTYLKVHETIPAQEFDAPQATLSPERSYAVVEQEHLVYDGVPAEGAEIHRISISYPDASEGISSVDSLGRIFHTDDGRVRFEAEESGLWELDHGQQIIHILFENDTLGVVYEASCPGGVGVMYFAPDDFSFEASVVSPVWEANRSLADNAPARGITEESSQDTASLETAPKERAEEMATMRYYDGEAGMEMVAFFTCEPMPAYTVEVVLAENAMYDDFGWTLLNLLYPQKDRLLPVLGISLVLLVLCAVYLCCAAARRPGTEECRAGGLNRMPLDGYLALVIGGIIAAAFVGVEGTEYLLDGSLEVALSLGGAMLFVAAALIVGFCFAFVAQIKTPGGFCWKNTLVTRGLDLCVKLCLWGIRAVKWLWNRLVPMVKWLWKLFTGILRSIFRLLGGILRRIWGWFVRFVALLPLTWQWLLGGGAMAVLLMMAFASRSGFAILLSLGCCAALILYGTYAFGILLEAVKRMSKGELEQQVEDKWLLGSFRDLGEHLNSLAGVAVVAAQKQLKSERMKTELITNVSHDIKTPLTSIINYVDLLEKPHTEAQQKEYLEVLSRQSQRLKKLIDDLMEMSKASTGNMAVAITTVDAGEAVNQALGEFADKLEKAKLTPIFRRPEEPVLIRADGALTWRVMSNILGNAVKYALPGTRLYLDLSRVEGTVVISLKNISREELNVDAEELLERFVRGDVSRNTEGSGLGLNIAQSLMELQKGSLQILVDGDLFKVTLIFPGA